jgi:probable HAF family extracellular repeat protein
MPLAISSLGQVVGYSNTTGGNWHAFSWSKTAGMKDLGTLDGGRSTSAVANGVNDLGQIVGTSSCGSSCTHAALWTSTGIQDLGTLPGSTISAANAINNLSQVVGQSGHALYGARPQLASVRRNFQFEVRYEENHLLRFVPSSAGVIRCGTVLHCYDYWFVRGKPMA